MRRAALLTLSAALVTRPAFADDPKEVSDVEHEESRPGDTWREINSGLLFLPRTAIELLFIATGTAAGLVESEQVVPRVNDLLHPPPGEIRVFPTAFAETGSTA